jgi:hypothetical protein
MRKLTVTLLAFAFGMTCLRAQTAGLKGKITDTINKQFLYQAVVAILQPKDSVLVKFTRTNNAGEFELNHLPAGKFILMVSYPKFADYLDEVTLEENQQKSMGSIPVILKSQLLQEVIIKQKIAAIRIKGDTTEYKADSFRVNANANVQELLKKLPGIQVNGKGEITAQGEKVEKVLVDGEEFFSDDPAVVTQNLRADIVDKVQVFDKKSDQADFTGIDDGQKTKTINLQLKEDKKKGYFGKIEAGSDFDRYRYGKGMFNAFRGKKKIAAYITNDNTKFESLNWSERRNYSADLNMNVEVNDDGGMMMYSNGDDFSFGKGFPTSTTTGLLFSNKWNKDKQATNTTYQFNQLSVDGTNSSITQTILPDTSFINTTEQSFQSSRSRHRVNSVYDWQIDSSSSVKLTLTGSIIKNQNNSRFSGKSISEENILINRTDRTTVTDDETKNLIGKLLWRKKLQKKGRTLSVSADFNFTDRDNNGFLTADNNFYNQGGALLQQELLDQKKTTVEQLTTLNSKISYTEPLAKYTFLELNYQLGIGRNNSERNTLEKIPGDLKYNQRVDTLSNHFIFNTTANTGAFNIRHNKTKYNFSFGAGIGRVVFNQQDVVSKVSRQISFINFLPSASINLTPKKQRRFGLTYNGNTRNPSLQQIQPLIDNTDPLNIVIGNKTLKQEFNHNFRFNISDYKVLKSKSIYLNANLVLTNNAITNANTIDSLGRRVNQAINVKGNYNFNLYAGYGFEIAPSVNLNFNIGPSVRRFVNVINGQRNVNDNKSFGGGLYAGYWSEKWINYWINFEARYNSSTSTIRPDAITKYWSYSASPNVEMKLPKKFYINIDSDMDFYQRTSVFTNSRNIYIVNGSIKKTFTKSESLEVKLYVNDIFNQNLGVSRNITSNFVTETTQQTIQRYFMFSLAYNFSKNGKPAGW